MDADTHTYMHAYILYGEVTVYWTYNYIINNNYLTVPINKVLYLKGSTSFHCQATYEVYIITYYLRGRNWATERLSNSLRYMANVLPIKPYEIYIFNILEVANI